MSVYRSWSWRMDLSVGSSIGHQPCLALMNGGYRTNDERPPQSISMNRISTVPLLLPTEVA